MVTSTQARLFRLERVERGDVICRHVCRLWLDHQNTEANGSRQDLTRKRATMRLGYTRQMKPTCCSTCGWRYPQRCTGVTRWIHRVRACLHGTVNIILERVPRNEVGHEDEVRLRTGAFSCPPTSVKLFLGPSRLLFPKRVCAKAPFSG